MSNPAHTAYYDAIKADDAYHDELKRVYGKRAQEMRYHPKEHTDAALITARKRKVAADEKFRVEYRRPVLKNRRRNPRGKFDRCVADVSRSRSALNPYAVCASRLKPKRRRRKRNVTRRGSRGQLFSLLARKANQPPMVYTGDKFARHGKPVLFQNLKTAKAVASFMHRQYPVLRGYSIWARAV